MTRHLEKCRGGVAASEEQPGRKSAGPSAQVFHLLIEGRDQTEYWLHLDVRADATLDELDSLLRGMWLECCGHLSAFNVGRDRYRWEPPGGFDDENDFFDGLDEMFGMPKEHNLDVTLAEALPPGTAFTYEYDFGSTTELKGRVLTEREAVPPPTKPIALLARNTPPSLLCDECGEPASWVGWVDEDDNEPRTLCDPCIEAHDYDTEMLLPVVNSPRMGVCAYTGPTLSA